MFEGFEQLRIETSGAAIIWLRAARVRRCCSSMATPKLT